MYIYYRLYYIYDILYVLYIYIYICVYTYLDICWRYSGYFFLRLQENKENKDLFSF